MSSMRFLEPSAVDTAKFAEERLVAYPWSSLVWYLAAPEHQPGWMRVDRLLGEHGLAPDTAVHRQEFERQMEARRSREADAESVGALRLGWCLGSPEFRRQMDAGAD